MCQEVFARKQHYKYKPKSELPEPGLSGDTGDDLLRGDGGLQGIKQFRFTSSLSPLFLSI